MLGNFSYKNATKLYFGEDALDYLRDELPKYGDNVVLICVGGRGYYQAWGEAPVEMTPGTLINIPANVKHWHGAAPGSWFSHLAIEIPGGEASTEWCEPVDGAQYGALG